MSRIRDLNYVAFDLEATCHPSLKYHEIIEIGAVKLKPGTLELLETYESLVRPTTPIIRPIVEKTGITDETVRTAKAVTDIWDSFKSFVEGTILIGYKTYLDLGILKRTAEREGLDPIDNSFIDMFSLGRKLFPDKESYKLEDYQKHLNLSVKAHRAKDDAILTAALFRKCVELLEKRYEISEFAELTEFAKTKGPWQKGLF